MVEYLASHVSISKVNDKRGAQKPRVVLLLAPCRSGTTALSRAIAYANVPVLYQKVKEALRLSLLDRLGEKLSQKERDYFHVNSTVSQSLSVPNHEVIFMKETFGGAHPLESFFDPLGVLLKAGWRGEDITLVTMVREPLATFASWVKNWGHIANRKQLLQNYNYAIEAIKHSEVVAKENGVKIVPLDFELFGRAYASEVLHYLFRECNLSRSAQTIESAVNGWNCRPNFLESDIGMLMPQGDAHISYLKNVHKDLVASDSLCYTRAKTQSLKSTLTDPGVSPAETQKIFDGVYSHNAFHKLHQRRTAIRKANIPPQLNPLIDDSFAFKPHLAALFVTGCFAFVFHIRPGFGDLLPSITFGLGLQRVPLSWLVVAMAEFTVVYTVALVLIACGGPVQLYREFAGYWGYLLKQNKSFRDSKLYVNKHQLPALFLGLFSSPFRALPNVQIIGAQKCATTTLHNLLVKNQNGIVSGSLSKESHFIDGRSVFGKLVYTSPLPSLLYRSFFPSLFKKAAHFLRYGTELRILDCTPVNLLLESAPIILRKFCKKTKIIAILREPVDRIKSHFRHNLNWGREVTNKLQEALAQESDLWKSNETGNKFHGILPSEHLEKSYTRRSKYIDQVRRYEIWFGKENMLLLSFREVTEQPEETYNKCCKFLGLDHDIATDNTSQRVEIEHKNKTPDLNIEPTPSDVTKLLMASFREDNNLLASDFEFKEANRWNKQYDSLGVNRVLRRRAPLLGSSVLFYD